MVEESYVNFETAKLLKENGFDIETEHEMWYVIKQFSTGCHWNSCTYKVGDITREYDKNCCIPMPTLQMAMKWLREVHNFHVDSSIYTDTDGDSEHEYTYTYWDWLIFNSKSGRRIAEPQIGCGRYDSYEQACEAAIKYCLENLI